LEEDDCGAGVGLVGGVDSIPIRVTCPFGGASEAWATRTEQSGANEIQIFHSDERRTALGGLTGDDLWGLRPRLVEPHRQDLRTAIGSQPVLGLGSCLELLVTQKCPDMASGLA
jgi:hypothetical protein